ncbi:hypothetical protein HS7_20590 [Sulfolobales archaeon HS-7]|nr:hypothetical protein HS7_20590 [Sulfolobales archaeon HS-7]
MIPHANVDYAKKGEGENNRDVSSVPLSSKESSDPHTVKLGRWLRAKSYTGS